jgi:adenosylmethionine-8-amino-7-oxononanoate aminotransferase
LAGACSPEAGACSPAPSAWGGGTVDGKRSDRVLLAPPFIVTDAHTAEIVDKLGESIDAAVHEIGS